MTRRRVIRRCVIGVVATVTTLALGCAGLTAAWLAGVRVPFASGTTFMQIQKIATADQAGSPTQPFFMLLVGNDSRPGISGARGDALHLVGVNPATNQATMLNIPRDTCWQGDKINAANTRGPRASADAVGGLTGVGISYVVDVDFAGFTSLVDGVGGLSIDIPSAMNDHFSGAIFAAGPAHLAGSQALAFSRDRHDYPNSDITRTANQGLLIIAAMKQLSAQNRSAAGEFKLLMLLGRHARLDGLGLSDLYRLGRIAFRIDPNQVRSVTIPIGGGSCLSLAGSAASLFADFRDDAVLQTH